MMRKMECSTDRSPGSSDHSPSLAHPNPLHTLHPPSFLDMPSVNISQQKKTPLSPFHPPLNFSRCFREKTLIHSVGTVSGMGGGKTASHFRASFPHPMTRGAEQFWPPLLAHVAPQRLTGACRARKSCCHRNTLGFRPCPKPPSPLQTPLIAFTGGHELASDRLYLWLPNYQ